MTWREKFPAAHLQMGKVLSPPNSAVRYANHIPYEATVGSD